MANCRLFAFLIVMLLSFQSFLTAHGTATFPKRRMLKANGKKLKILVPDFGTFQNLLQVNFDPRKNISSISGYCGDVFNAAFNALDNGVGVEIIPLPYKEGVTYDDVIQKIYRKKYDGAVADITITANRSVYVNFTLPFTDLGIGTMVLNAKKNMWIFLDPLREKLQSNLSRFVVTVWLFVVLVLTSSYTATLSSLLTVQQIGLKERSIGFQGLSSIGGSVYNNLNIANIKIEKLYTPEAYAKALTSGSVAAIIDEILYVKSVIAMYPAGDFSLIATASTTNGFGFVFQKGSPLAREMSIEIEKMREDGTLKALEDKWLKRQSALMSKEFSSPSPKILNLYGLRGLFLISGVSMTVALLVTMVRLAREKWHVKNKMNILRSILRRSPEIHAQDSDEDSTV